MRFADEVLTLEYTPESWTSTSEEREVRRKGDAGHLLKDEDSGESEGQEVQRIKRQSDVMDMVKECIAQIPADQRR